jgi:hypothetical protein
MWPVERLWKAASTRASSTVAARGFSTRHGMPVSSKAPATAACVEVGVATTAKSAAR